MDAEKTAGATGTGVAGGLTPLVERERELAAIGSTLDAAEDGAGSVLVLEGEAGTGKTRLLEEADGLASERGFSVLRAHGAELERGFAFGVVRQLFERRIAEATDVERDELLAGAAAPLAPLLRGAATAQPPPPDQLFALFHGLYWLAAQLAEERPLLLVVDDLHWADQPSHRALAYLAARAEELPLALALGFRLGEPSPAADPRALAGSASAAVSLRLRPLSEHGAGQMLESLLGTVDPGFAAAAHRASDGNPHLLRELAATTASEGLDTDERGSERLVELASPAAGAWVKARLAHLGAEAAQLASSLAVLERSPVELAAVHAELSEAAAQAAADRLCEAGILERTLPLRFAHPLLREAIYHELAPAACSAAHRRAAEVLSERNAPTETVAAHLLLCERVGEAWASAQLRTAAGDAAMRGAPAEAARLLHRALEEPGGAKDAGLLLELGSAEAAIHQPDAREHLEASIELARDPVLRVSARAALSTLAWAGGDFRGAFENIRGALGELAPGTGGILEAQLLTGLTPGRAVPELVDSVRAELQTPRRGAGGELTPAEVARLSILGVDAAYRGERAAAEEMAVAVAVAAEASEQTHGIWLALAGLTLCWLGRCSEAEALAAALEQSARSRGSTFELYASPELRMNICFYRGQVASLLAASETLLTFSEQAGGFDDAVVLPVRVYRAHCLIERGDAEAAEQSLAIPPEVEGRLRGVWGWVLLPYGRSLVATARGRWQEALDQALLCGERATAIQARTQDWYPWQFVAARAAAKLGDRERAVSIGTEELEWARRTGSVRVEGLALMTLGSIASGDEGIELLSEAVAKLDRAEVELERARARLELGMALRRERHPRDAREPLREALEIAARTGATAVAERALSELQAAGGRPRRERTSGLEALTPREREIAELGASGLSNREIAERLFVSRKTVEAHLRTIFRKLDIGSRQELSTALEVGPGSTA